MRRNRRRRRPGIRIPTTSMGDIAFLLIIFFILCSTKKVGVRVTPPTAADLVALPKPRIYVAIDANETFHLDGQRVDGISEIQAGLAERLARVDANAPPDLRTVILECDRSVRKEVFEPVLEAIAEAGGIIGAVGTEKTGRPK